ncbi:MAG: DUF2851 family protein [Bacteroidaceae bacterium]|nr:DUF2851 family protein [Bacteroidaceae bacterium]
MERLLHYAWQHRMFNTDGLRTTRGLCVQILYCGQYNVNQGPDFLNARILIGDLVWAGNVEIHTRSSDWNRHGHNLDPVYNTTILHVVEQADVEVFMQDGRPVPQLEIDILHDIADRYGELVRTSDYPRCRGYVREIPAIKVRSWLDSLLIERLVGRSRRISSVLDELEGNWNHVAFVAVARTLGFGLNGDPMEMWAKSLPYDKLYRQLDAMTIESVEKAFLDTSVMTDKIKAMWRYMRIRPQNFPEARIRQLASVFYGRKCNIHGILESQDVAQLKRIFLEAGFSRAVCRLLLINAACPLIFSYGIIYGLDEYRSRALYILSVLKAEDNYVLRQWKSCGLEVSTAADSQALIQLKREYCERFRCLDCRFGFEVMSQK